MSIGNGVFGPTRLVEVLCSYKETTWVILDIKKQHFGHDAIVL